MHSVADPAGGHRAAAELVEPGDCAVAESVYRGAGHQRDSRFDRVDGVGRGRGIRYPRYGISCGCDSHSDDDGSASRIAFESISGVAHKAATESAGGTMAEGAADGQKTGF